MSKKLLSLALIVLLLIGVAAPLTANAVYEMYVYTKNGGSLNVRDMPSSDGNVIGTLPYGHRVGVDHDLGNGWVEIVWGSNQAFVQSRYLISFDPGSFVTPTPGKVKATATPKQSDDADEQAKLKAEINSEKSVESFYIEVRAPRASSWVNFRKGPSKTTSRIASFADGKELIVEGETNKWYRARDPETNKVGYIFKTYTAKITKQAVAVVEKKDETTKLGSLNVNGAFDLTCKLPDDYNLQVVNVRGGSIIASILSDDMTKPQMYLSIAFDEAYADVESMNSMTDDELAILEDTFSEMNDVEITYSKTGHGTKLMIARETGGDTDFVDILAIYKGYFIEFNMSPNPNAANQTLSNAQIGMCIDFLTDLNFVPAK